MLTITGVEHRAFGFIHEQVARALEDVRKPPGQRRQVIASRADPSGQRRAVQLDTGPGEDLRLPVQGKVVGIFGDKDLRDQRLRGQPAFDQMRRRGRLRDTLRTGPAGIFGTDRDDYPELRRHAVKALGAVFADSHHLAAAARTLKARRLDYPLCQGSCRMDFKVNENQKWAMNRKEHDVSDRTEGSGHREDASAA